MRIAYFTETFLPIITGVVVTMTHLLDYVANEGHQSVLFVPHGTVDSYAKTKIYHHRSLKTPIYPELRIATPLARVEKNLLAFKPDLIHLVSPTSLGLAGLHVARKHRIPVVASYHTDFSGFARRWKMGVFAEPIFSYYRSIHNRADVNLVPSYFSKRQVVAKGFKRVQVWPGGVNLERFSPSKRSRKWRTQLTGGDSEKTLVLIVGRLSREKRVEMLLPVIERIPGIRLVIVGDGPFRKKLERKFAGTSTHFAGYQHGDDLARAYAAGDIFAYTGAEETFGNVVAEAMASGLPIVAPNSGGVVDLVEHGKTGFLYSAENGEALVRYVKKLVNEPKLAKRMGRAGENRAHAFSWKASFETLFNIYEDLLSSQRGKKNKG